RQQRLIEVPETRDGMLKIYALRECQITSLIAARNNQLGRVAPPSQQWLYELKGRCYRLGGREAPAQSLPLYAPAGRY
ncbi:DUF3080 family protein, partial [Psychrobacter sp. SIMBA_152]